MEIDWDAQPLGEVSDSDLAESLSVSYHAVYYNREKRGIPRYSGPRKRKLRAGRYGPKNNWWKGGRTKTAHGYILVKINGHHLADCRGYVYEHRLIAEQVLGRELRPGEVVHHRNGDKADNSPINLLVCPSKGHHFVHHRTRDKGLRLPDQGNPVIRCACGCSAWFSRFDRSGRPRRFIPGHNPSASPSYDLVLSELRARRSAHRSEIVAGTGLSLRGVAVILSRLKRDGKAENCGGGVWVIKEER